MTSTVTHTGVGTPWSAVPCRTILELVLEACEARPDHPALIFEDGLVVTRAELLDCAERFAGFLSFRVRPGEPVAVMLENRAEFMIAWLAVIAVRSSLVSISPTAGEHDAAHMLRDSNTVLAIAGETAAPLIERLRPDCPSLRDVVTVDGPEPDGLVPYGDGLRLALRDSQADPSDIVNVFYTSGTTGPPKGCMLDHHWWLRATDVELRLSPKGRDDRLLCCLQFFYADPALQLLVALRSGASLVVMRRFSVSRFWQTVHDFGVTELLTIASMPVLLLKAPPGPLDRSHRVRHAVQVGLPAELHSEMVERWGFPFLDNYGSTEAGFISRVPLELAGELIGSGSIGLPVPEMSVRIVDEEGHDVPTGEVGEFVLQAPGMMRGYLNRPDATADVLRDGWLHTGDLGRSDERGFLYFVGRKKDMIRRSGENVSASEVEEVLRTHPGILDAAVIAVPDPLRGEEIKAYVILVDGNSQRESISPEAIAAFCRSKLAPYKVPRYIEYRSTDFPRTPSMRVQKDELRRERPDLLDGVWDREQALGRG